MTASTDPPRPAGHEAPRADETRGRDTGTSGKARISPRRKLLYTIIVIVLLIGLTEVLLRVGYRVRTGSWDCFAGVRFASELYEPHPYLCYVMKPDVEVRGYDGQVRTNRWGFRGRDVAQKKPEGIVRIACLGGSTTFSLNASDNDHTWPAQLERILNERHPAARFEVLNFGTPGYTAVESMLNLELRGLAFQPDIVLMHDAMNDVPAVFRSDATSDYSHFRGFYTRMGGGWFAKTAIGRLIMLASMQLGGPGFGGKPELSKEGVAIFQRHLESTILLVRPRGIEAVIVSMPDRLPADEKTWPERNNDVALARILAEAQRRLCQRWPVPLIDLAATFPKAPEYFTDDVHKTDAGLELQARMIADELEEAGVLSKVLDRPATTRPRSDR